MWDVEQVYIEYMPQVYKYLFSLCQKEDLAEELTQEVFCQALKYIDGFQEIGEIMGRNENWARVTFYRGKQKIRKELRDEM